jgi:hypothetical protein
MQQEESEQRIRANAVLYALLPGVAEDPEDLEEVKRSMAMTSPRTAEEVQRFERWLGRHLSFATLPPSSARVAVAGGLAVVPGAKPLRYAVIKAMSATDYTLYEIDQSRSFVGAPRIC